MCVKSISNKEKISLEELFKDFDGDYSEDFSWDDPVGYSGATRHTYFLRGSDYMSKVDQHQLYKIGSLIYPNVSKADYNK